MKLPRSGDESPQPTLISPPEVTSQSSDKAKFFLASIVESSQDSTIEAIDFNGIITSWNQASEHLYGFSSLEAIGQNLMALTLPQNLAEVLNNVQQVRQSQRVEVFDSVRTHKQGQEITLEVVMSPVKDEQGDVIGVSIIARDVTLSRRSDEALRESEEKYRKLFASIDEGYCIIEVLFAPQGKPFNWRFLEVNPAFEKNNGLTNATGKTILELAPDIEPKWFEIYGRVARTGEPLRFQEHSIALGRGFNLYAFPIGSPDENHVAVIFTDISQSKRAEESSRKSEHSLASIFAQAAVGLSEIDPDGRFLRVNDELCRILGRECGEILKLSVADVTHPDDIAKTLSVVQQVVSTHQRASLDKRYLRPDGGVVWANSSLTALLDEDGQLKSFLAVTADLTLRRQAEADLREAHAELENRVEERTQKLQEEIAQRRQLEAQRNRLMQRIVQVQEEERGRIARELHDNLGQHLTAILMAIQAINNQEEDLPEGERRASAKDLNYLQDITNDLTDIAHRLAWELRPAALDEVGLAGALRDYISNWKSDGIRVHFTSTLSKKETGVSHEAETALYRVMQEALTNVQRHAKASDVSVILDSRSQPITLIIEDDGAGFGIETATLKNRLGLVGMRERMELVGGKLEIESAIGVGTTIYAHVPLETKMLSSSASLPFIG